MSEDVFGDIKIHTNDGRTSEIDDLGRRIETLEKQFQLKKLSSMDGLTYFDIENNELVVYDGTITGGTITGSTVQSATTGLRVVITGNQISVYDAGNIERQRIGGASVTYFDAAGTQSGQVRGENVADVGEAIVLDSLNTYLPTGAALVFNDGAGTKPLFYCSAGDVMVIEGADFYVNGDVGGDTKSFIIDHPLKEGKKLRYVCPEFPEVLAMCRGNGEVQLPDHFVAITDPKSVQIIRDPQSGNWLATAVRLGYTDFDCEPDALNTELSTAKRPNTIQSLKQIPELKGRSK